MELLSCRQIVIFVSTGKDRTRRAELEEASGTNGKLVHLPCPNCSRATTGQTGKQGVTDTTWVCFQSSHLPVSASGRSVLKIRKSGRDTLLTR
jgi:hypothetical protein